MEKPKTRLHQTPLPFRLVKKVFPVLEKMIPSLAKTMALRFFYRPFSMPLRQQDRPFIQQAATSKRPIKGKSTVFYEWGKGQEMVILAHGWAGRASQFKHLVEHLVEHQYKVIAFDAPAHGESKGKESSVFHISQCILDIIQTHGKPKAIVGHSLGAIASLMSVVNGANCPKLVMISAPTLPDDILYRFRTRINASEKVEHWIKEYGQQKYLVTFDSVSGVELAKRLSPQDLLVIHDREDPEVGMEHHYALMKHVPFAKSILLRGYGHSRILKAPETLQAIEHFIRPNRATNARSTANITLKHS